MLWKKKRKSELAVRALYPRPKGRGFAAQAYKERKEEFNLLSVFLFIFSFCCMQFVHNEQF